MLVRPVGRAIEVREEQLRKARFDNGQLDLLRLAHEDEIRALKQTKSEVQRELRERDERLASLLHVVNVAVSAKADADDFPPEWLFHYRWGKGAGGSKVPGGGAITFLTVGGRTSAVVLSKQRKGERPAAETIKKATKAKTAKKVAKKTTKKAAKKK